jgi:hypothetical protein
MNYICLGYIEPGKFGEGKKLDQPQLFLWHNHTTHDTLMWLSHRRPYG